MGSNSMDRVRLNHVKLLISRGEDMNKIYEFLGERDRGICNVTDEEGSTLLHVAAQFKNVTVLQQLIKLGSNVNSQNSKGTTPLMLAAVHGPESAMKLLLDADADIFVKDEDNQNSLRIGLRNGRVNKSSGISCMFLHKLVILCRLNNKLIAQRLLEVDCSLAQIIFMDEPDFTEKMIISGLPVNQNHLGDGSTALHVAVQMKSLENISILLENNADVNATDELGRIPLSRINWLRGEDTSLRILKLLIGKGTNIEYGKTPLMCAVNAAKASMTEFLIDNGADVNFKIDTNSALLETIVDDKTDRMSCCVILLTNGANIEDVLFDETIKSKNALLAQPVLAHLAIMDGLGKSISDSIRDKINGKEMFQLKFELYKEDVKKMKSIVIYELPTLFNEPLTLFKVLFEIDEKKLVKLLINDQDFLYILQLKGRKELESNDYKEYCVHRIMRYRLERIIARALRRSRVVQFICSVSNFHLNARDIATDMIIDFLQYQDMKTLDETFT